MNISPGLTHAAMVLRLKCELLAGRIEAATVQRDRAVHRYGHARVLCNRLLNRASGEQSRASQLGRELHGLGGELARLRRLAENVQFFGGNTTSITADLAEVERLIQSWGVAPTGDEQREQPEQVT